MVRSNIDYCGPLLHNISEHNKKMIEAIQYHSMLHILNWPWKSSHTKMREELGLKKLSDRYKRLSKEYVDSSILNNRLIRKLKEDFEKFKEINNIDINKENNLENNSFMFI